MKAWPRPAQPCVAALGLWLSLCPPCGGHRRLAAGTGGSRRVANEASIGEALRWLERTEKSVAKLERSFSRARSRFARAGGRVGPGAAGGKKLAAGAFLQRFAAGSKRSDLRKAIDTDSIAQGDLNTTDLALGALERSLATARSELSRAERESVNVTLDAAPAHRDLMEIHRATSRNARILKNLSLETAQMNLSLKEDNDTLGPSLAKAEDLSNASQFMEDEAGRQMEAGEAFEQVRHEIEEAMETGPNSVRAARERVETLEAELEEFQGGLDEKVRDFLVRRLRRGGRQVRKALRRMAYSMSPLVDFKEAARGPTVPPLGLDLGLAGAS